MTDERKKELLEHWESAAPEARGGILAVFAESAPKEELEFLQKLQSGKYEPDSYLPETDKRTGSKGAKTKEKKR